jgi:hypothetical protein
LWLLVVGVVDITKAAVVVLVASEQAQVYL